MTWAATAVVGSAIIGAVASNRAASKGAQAIGRGQDILAQSREQARQDVLRLFPEAQQAQTQGFQQAQEFLAGQVLPQQAGLFQQGNIAAQQTLLGGLPQVQRAILGQPTDLSGLQPTQFQLPQFNLTGLGGRLDPNAPPPQQLQQPQQPQASLTREQIEDIRSGIGQRNLRRF